MDERGTFETVSQLGYIVMIALLCSMIGGSVAVRRKAGKLRRNDTKIW
jgi:hypothetical protein